MARILDTIFFLYFLSHIPITVLFDSQVLFANSDLPYPSIIREMVKNYSASFKDPMVLDPPAWYQSFVVCEMLFQFPFFFVAVYAFWQGQCRWIRVPAIVYASHVATTVLPILCHIMLYDFSASKLPGPATQTERLTLLTIYAPYLLVPVLLLLTMLFSPTYQPLDSADPRASSAGGGSRKTSHYEQPLMKLKRI